nr:phage tail length tape measure family protein [Gemmatimonadaceae bacterium]
MADVATLGIRVDASGAITVLDQYGTKVAEVEKKSEKLESGVDKLQKGFGRLRSQLAGLAAATGLTFLGAKVLQETIQAQQEMALLENTIRATGGAAGRSVEDVGRLADEIQRLTSLSSGAATQGMTRLLGYTSIQGDTFDRATRAVMDFATAYSVTTVQAAETVGRALEYPTKATEALSKQGFRFSEEQVRVIKSLVETGRMAEAQTIILESLEEATEGAAAAVRDTLGGALANLNNVWNDSLTVSRDASGGIIDAINGIASAIGPALEFIGTEFNKVSLIVTSAVANIRRAQIWIANSPFASKSAREGPWHGNESALIAEVEAWRQAEFDRILAPADPAAGPATTPGGHGPPGATDSELKAIEKAKAAYETLRQSMRDAAEDYRQESLDLERTTLVRAYAANALEHERRVRGILAEQAPQYHDELVRESEAVMASANAHAQRIGQLKDAKDTQDAITETIKAAIEEEARYNKAKENKELED